MVHSIFSLTKANIFFNRNPVIGATLISLLLESILLVFILDSTFSPSWLLFAHILVLHFPAILIYRFWRAKKETYFLILLTLSTAVLGALGALSVLVLLLVFHRVPRVSRFTTPDLYESILSGLNKTEQEELFEQLTFGNFGSFDQSSVIPFIDVLHFGNQRQKQTLIALLINNYQRKFSPVLKEAIKDKDNSIRVLASMGMSQIENRFLRRAIEIESIKGPADESKKKYLKTLGRHYDDYAYSEILDEIMQTDFRNLAIKAYEDYLHAYSLDEEVLFWLGRALLRNGKTEDAAKIFEVALRNDLLTPKNFVWYLESLYRLKDYKKLWQAASDYSRNLKKPEETIPAELYGVIKAWSHS